MLSPFEKHRDILLNGNYSAAGSLQQFVLSLYNSSYVKFEADRIRAYDRKHRAIFMELISSFQEYGENDPAFLDLCRDMWDLRKQWGREHLEEVQQHKRIDPKAYDGGEQSWHNRMRHLDELTETYREKRWIGR